VTLHSYGVGLLTYVSITRIEEETNIGVCRVQGMRRCADGVLDERDYSRAVIVSAAEVTAKARAAWGAEWSCPGAEPSVEEYDFLQARREAAQLIYGYFAAAGVGEEADDD